MSYDGQPRSCWNKKNNSSSACRNAIFSLFLICICNPISAAEFQPPLLDHGAPGGHLTAMLELVDSAHTVALAAADAATPSAIKLIADDIYASVWGRSSGLIERTGAEVVRGWKTRWQVTYTDFDPNFGIRYGGLPADVTDPAQLGVVGRGRYVRRHLVDRMRGISDEQERLDLEHLIASLNNVIGWMRIDDGVTKAERQPRVDLTYQWDAPKAFWQSSADTGWIFEVQAQALNILKSDYGNDIQSARDHAQALVGLLEKCRQGVDANGDGVIDSVRMEGGLMAVAATAKGAGVL